MGNIKNKIISKGKIFYTSEKKISLFNKKNSKIPFKEIYILEKLLPDKLKNLLKHYTITHIVIDDFLKMNIKQAIQKKKKICKYKKKEIEIEYRFHNISLFKNVPAGISACNAIINRYNI